MLAHLEGYICKARRLKTGSDSPNSLMLMSATKVTGSLRLLPLHLSLMKEGEDAGVKSN